MSNMFSLERRHINVNVKLLLPGKVFCVGMMWYAIELVGGRVFQAGSQIFPDDVTLSEFISFHHLLVAFQVLTIN